MHKILFLVISLLISYEALSQEKTLTISVDLRLRNDKTMRLLMLGDSTTTVSVKRRKLANSNSIILSSDTLHVVQYLFSANSLGGDIELLVKGSQITTKVSSIINKKDTYQCFISKMIVQSDTGIKYLVEGLKKFNLL
jgi:hypothetical protein